MPRGFLVKRSKKACMVSYRSRSSDEEQDDIVLDRVPSAFSQQFSPYKPFHSPDSGYGQSPVTVSNVEYDGGAFAFEAESVRSVPSPTLSTRSLPSPVSSSHSPVPIVPSLMMSAVSAPPTPKHQTTGSHSLKRPFTDSAVKPSQKVKKTKYKAARKLNFNEHNSSPVNGTIIMADEDVKDNADQDTKDIKISSNPGDIVCQLCKGCFNDPLSLAQHKCSRIVHVEYRCPECEKVFNCPANLASHRRWHKPRPQNMLRQTNSSPRILPAAIKTNSKLAQLDANIGLRKTTSPLSDTTSLSDRSTPSPRSGDGVEEHTYDCNMCGKKFRRQGYLRKHMQQHGESVNHPCQYCGRIFDSLTSREKHLLTHLSPPHEVVCKICGGVFLDKNSLEQHVKMHETRDIYHCKYCISSFPSPAGLTHHLNKCHTVDNRNVLLLHVPRMTQELERSMIST
ncbi:insulinoma-associated protein 1a-like [Antedon mediterranea]|uniref:insulinoma-associated protein 1a-like n=1 Tax=Antedon mediterranea TaxID=105859 RepID=UPI003AF8F8E1